MKLLVALAALALASEPAHADAGAAARAFAEGQAAQLEGDYERAAQSFELAFSIQPSKEALRSAVRTRQQNNQLPRAASLAEVLLAMYGDDAMSATLARDVIAEAKPKLARIAIKCAAPCSIAVGGRSASLIAADVHAIFLAPGTYALEVSFDRDASVKRDLTVTEGEDSSLEIAKPEPTKPPPPVEPPPKVEHEAPPHGVSPTVVLIGAGVTVVVAGLATWSGIDTLNAHDKYVENPTDAAFDAGRGKQLRTNILFVGTGVLAVTTGAIALFWTNWHGPQPAVNATGEGATVGIAGSF